jgi:hypothetical protein
MFGGGIMFMFELRGMLFCLVCFVVFYFKGEITKIKIKKKFSHS